MSKTCWMCENPIPDYGGNKSIKAISAFESRLEERTNVCIHCALCFRYVYQPDDLGLITLCGDGWTEEVCEGWKDVDKKELLACFRFQLRKYGDIKIKRSVLRKFYGNA